MKTNKKIKSRLGNIAIGACALIATSIVVISLSGSSASADNNEKSHDDRRSATAEKFAELKEKREQGREYSKREYSKKEYKTKFPSSKFFTLVDNENSAYGKCLKDKTLDVLGIDLSSSDIEIRTVINRTSSTTTFSDGNKSVELTDTLKKSLWTGIKSCLTKTSS